MTPSRKSPAPKPVKAWATKQKFYDGSYEICEWTVSARKRDAIHKHVEFFGLTWKRWYRDGDRCIRVTITPA